LDIPNEKNCVSPISRVVSEFNFLRVIFMGLKTLQPELNYFNPFFYAQIQIPYKGNSPNIDVSKGEGWVKSKILKVKFFQVEK